MKSKIMKLTANLTELVLEKSDNKCMWLAYEEQKPSDISQFFKERKDAKNIR